MQLSELSPNVHLPPCIMLRTRPYAWQDYRLWLVVPLYIPPELVVPSMEDRTIRWQFFEMRDPDTHFRPTPGSNPQSTVFELTGLWPAPRRYVDTDNSEYISVADLARAVPCVLENCELIRVKGVQQFNEANEQETSHV